MEIVLTTSLIAMSIVCAADTFVTIKAVQNQRKRLIALCNENADLHQENTHLQAVNAGLHRKKSDLEKQLDTCLNRGIEQNDKIIKLEKEHSDTKDKLKSAHDHISVLRAEIVKLNRQLNQRKRRG